MPALNDLLDLLQGLQSSAQPRPDLITPGSTGTLTNARPVTYAGRVSFGGETPQQILARVPVGELESGGQALGALPQRLLEAAAVKALIVPGARVYHGTPVAYRDVNLSNAAPGLGASHFVSTSPELASEYARGSISDSRRLASQAAYAPNVRPYQMASHRSLVTNMPVETGELQNVLDAIGQLNLEPKVTKHGIISPARQLTNLKANVQSQVLPEVSPGQQLRDVLYASFGVDKGEELLRRAGFKSIQYQGEDSVLNVPQQATKVLDLSILQNLVDALSGSKTR